MYETEMHFDDSFNFTHRQGLRLAASVTAFDSKREWDLDPAYGQL